MQTRFLTLHYYLFRRCLFDTAVSSDLRLGDGRMSICDFSNWHRVPWRHLRLLVWPWPLCCDWSHQSIPLLTSLADLRAAWPFWVIYGCPLCLLKIGRNLSSHVWSRSPLKSGRSLFFFADMSHQAWIHQETASFATTWRTMKTPVSLSLGAQFFFGIFSLTAGRFDLPRSDSSRTDLVLSSGACPIKPVVSLLTASCLQPLF